MTPLGSLPVVAESALPRDVRNGSADDKKAYKTALGFERMLVSQLVQQAMPQDEDAGPRGAAVQDAFADALMTAGGLGLARQIHAQIRREGA
jgi:hypothetical protein